LFWPNFQARAKLDDGFFEFVTPNENVAQAIMRNVVPFVDGKRVAPERFSVAPEGCLLPRNKGEQRNHAGCGKSELPLQMPTSDQIRNTPDDGNRDTDLRKVHVTIGMRLRADLNNSNHRDEHAEIPKPTGKQVRPCSSPGEHSHSNCNECGDGAGNLPGPQSFFEDWIKYAEARWPDRLLQVNDIAHECVVDSPHQWKVLSR